MTTHTKSYVATNREVKLSIGGKNYSKNLIGGTVSDSDITSGGIVFTSGSFELAGYDPSGVPIVESKINLGDLVTINVMFTDSNGASYVAPHPRARLQAERLPHRAVVTRLDTERCTPDPSTAVGIT